MRQSWPSMPSHIGCCIQRILHYNKTCGFPAFCVLCARSAYRWVTHAPLRASCAALIGCVRGAFSPMQSHMLSLSTFRKGGEGGLTPPPTMSEAPSFFLEAKYSGVFCPCWRYYPLLVYGSRTLEVPQPPTGSWHPDAILLEFRGKVGPGGYPLLSRG